MQEMMQGYFDSAGGQEVEQELDIHGDSQMSRPQANSLSFTPEQLDFITAVEHQVALAAGPGPCTVVRLEQAERPFKWYKDATPSLLPAKKKSK